MKQQMGSVIALSATSSQTAQVVCSSLSSLEAPLHMGREGRMTARDGMQRECLAGTAGERESSCILR